MVCAAVQDLVPGYALDALDPDDTARVDDHLARCRPCAQKLAELERTVAMLPYLSRRATPPPDVKATLFTRIAQSHTANMDARHAAAAQPVPSRSLTVHAIPAASSTIPASPSARETTSTGAAAGRSGGWRGRAGLPARGGLAGASQRGWRGYGLPVATTAIPLVLALALVGGWAYSLYDDASAARDDQEMMGTFSGVLASGEGNLYELISSADAPEAEGQFLASLDGNDGILLVSGLQPEQSGRTYEVWIEQDGQRFLYSDLDVDSRGNAKMLIEVDGTFQRCRGVYVQLAPVRESGGARPQVLWTSLTTPGPANGGKQTEGDPEIGSSNIATTQLSTK